MSPDPSGLIFLYIFLSCLLGAIIGYTSAVIRYRGLKKQITHDSWRQAMHFFECRAKEQNNNLHS